MAVSTKFLLFAGAVLAMVLLANAFARPYAQAPAGGAPSDNPESRGYAGHGHGGRTKWQVYRGPNQGYGKHGKFAPWGYYLTQPQDKKGYGYH